MPFFAGASDLTTFAGFFAFATLAVALDFFVPTPDGLPLFAGAGSSASALSFREGLPRFAGAAFSALLVVEGLPLFAAALVVVAALVAIQKVSL